MRTVSENTTYGILMSFLLLHEQLEEMQAEDMFEGAQQAIGMLHSVMGLLNPQGMNTSLPSHIIDSSRQNLRSLVGLPTVLVMCTIVAFT